MSYIYLVTCCRILTPSNMAQRMIQSQLVKTKVESTPGKLDFLDILYIFIFYHNSWYIVHLPFISWQLISSRIQLSESFDQVINVETLDSKDAANLALLERPELGITFTKVNCWKLTQFSKCVFLDADTLVSNVEIFYSLYWDITASTDCNIY